MEPIPGRPSEVERLLQEGTHRTSVDVRHFAQRKLSPVSSCGRSAVCDLLDATVQISPIGSVERHSTGSHGLATESIHAPAGIRIDCRFDAHVHLLVMYDGARRTGETSIVGLARSGLRNHTNKLTFVPAGHAYYEWHETATPTRVTFLYLDPKWCSKSSNAVALNLPRILFEDHVVLETATKLKSSIESGQSGNMLYAEAVASVLALELSRSHEAFSRALPPVKRGGLASWQMRGITAHIEEHLGEQTSLLTLARLARLSLHHFCRAFKQSFGASPHQYLVRRRIERAKILLAERASSVTDVGFALGYSYTSSFSVAFRKATGQTPAEFRRNFARAVPEPMRTQQEGATMDPSPSGYCDEL